MIKLKDIANKTMAESCINELAYKGNVGIVEMMQFFNKATDEQKSAMEFAIGQQNVPKVLELIKQVVGVDLIVSDTPTEPEMPPGPVSESKVKNWAEIRNENDPDGSHHDLRLTCVKCSNTSTCRCSKPKRTFEGLCYDCAGINYKGSPK